MKLRIGSFCSGIAAPEVAWSALGWEPVFFSEVDPFATAVLARRFPGVPNLGDMEALDERTVRRLGPVDVVVAGTPCQSFSVAGLRGGMADPRGNLALVLLRLLSWLRPKRLVWENVPGVLSSWSDASPGAAGERSREALGEVERLGSILGVDAAAELGADPFEEVDQSADFDTFLAGLSQLGYGWAWRVLDAQHFGVPQRRRRVFVVGHLGDWRPAAAVLFERHCLSGHPAPCRTAGPGVADDLAGVVGTCSSKWAKGTGGPAGDECQNLVTHSLRAGGHDASEDGTGRGTPIVPVSGALHNTANGNGNDDRLVMQPVAYGINWQAGGVGGGAHFEESSGTLIKGQVGAVAYQCQGGSVGPAGTLPRGNGNETGGVPFVIASANSSEKKRHARKAKTARSLDTTGGFAPQQGGTVVAQPFTIHGSEADAVASSTDVASCLGTDGSFNATNSTQTVVAADAPLAFQTRLARNDRGAPSEVVAALTSSEGGTHADTKPHVFGRGHAVRRLTPRECERLQGLPDDWTLIPYGARKKLEADFLAYLRHARPDLTDDALRDLVADGPRYRAIGNSMARPVLEWLGRRIELVEAFLLKSEVAA